MSQEQSRELWARYIAGEGLTDGERAELLQALHADASFREEVLEDIDLNGLLRSTEQSEIDGKSFAQSISKYLAHEENADRFVQQTASRLAHEGGRRKITRRAAPRPRPPFLILAVAAAAAVFGLAVFLSLSSGGTKEEPVRTVSRPPAPAPAPLPPAPAPEPPVRQPIPSPEKPTPEAPKPTPPPPAPEKPRPHPEGERPPAPESPKPPAPDVRPPEPPPAPRPETRTVVATVERVVGNVSRGPGPARAGDALLAGDGIRTRGSASRATLKFPDGTTLDVWAETTLDSISEAAGKRVVLTQGKITAQVTPQPAGRPMVVVAPHGEAKVVGTTLRILIEPGDTGSTRLEVTEGKVSFKRLSDGKTVDVPSGHFAVAAVGIELVSRPLAPARRLRNLNLVDLADNTWARLDVEMPKAAGMRAISWVYAAQAQLYMVYGGGGHTNESFLFDLGSERWTALEPNRPGAPGRPGAGNGIGAAYDTKRNLVWFFGGTTSFQGQDLGLWSFEPGTRKWTRVAKSNEPRQSCNAMAYDSHNDSLVTVGAAPASTWVFSISKQTWRPGGSETAPPLREAGEPAYRSMSFDPEFGQVLFFTGPPKAKGEIWAFDARVNKWRGFNPRVQPAARLFAGMTYDARNKVHLVVGGSLGDYAPGVVFNDLWAFDVKTNAWTEMRARNQPPFPEHCMMFAYDEEHNVSLLSHPDLGVWAYRYKAVKAP